MGYWTTDADGEPVWSGVWPPDAPAFDPELVAAGIQDPVQAMGLPEGTVPPIKIGPVTPSEDPWLVATPPDPDEDPLLGLPPWYGGAGGQQGQGGIPVAPSTASPGGLPVVRFAGIANRQLTGIRFGTIPQVVFNDAPPSWGAVPGVRYESGGGSSALLEP